MPLQARRWRSQRHYSCSNIRLVVRLSYGGLYLTGCQKMQDHTEEWNFIFDRPLTITISAKALRRRCKTSRTTTYLEPVAHAVSHPPAAAQIGCLLMDNGKDIVNLG